MAKNNRNTAVVNDPNNVDDLLGGASTDNAGQGTDNANSGTATDATGTTEDETTKPPTEGEIVAKSAEELEKEEIQKQLDALKAQEKELKAKLKGEKVKKERTLKGQMVAFKNKAGDEIVGLGQLYYVARAKGKLHYKEASQVIILPADYKEGDPINWPVEEPAAPAASTTPAAQA